MSNAINQSIPVPYGKYFVKQMQHKFTSKAGVDTLMPGGNFTAAEFENRYKVQTRRSAPQDKRLVEFENAL